MILTALDQATYFPNVTQTGSALDGLIAFSQALCESSYGANRPLEQMLYEAIVTVNPKTRTTQLPYVPVVSVSSVSVRQSRESWGRISTSEWWLTTGYMLDIPTGQLNFETVATEAKVSYVAGFDFAVNTAEVKQIKAIAGTILDYGANRFYGQLDSYLSNPPGDGQVESFNYVRPDTWLQTILTPLKKYYPRASS